MNESNLLNLNMANAVLIILADFLASTTDFFTFGLLSLPLAIIFGILISLMQFGMSGDGISISFLKGLVAGIAIAIPLPIAGSLLGIGNIAKELKA